MRPGYAAAYAYDANGNRTSKTLNGTTQTYAVDDGDKLLSVSQGGAVVRSYGYDAAGRTTSVTSSAGTTTLGYDFESRVTSINGPGVSNAYAYNGLDARVGKVDSTGTRTYRRDGAEVKAPVLSDGQAVYTPGVSQRRNGETLFELPDRLGTSVRQTNLYAAEQSNRVYDAFGSPLSTFGPFAPQGPFGFAGAHGYQEDGDTGLKLLGHRTYDASTGRFLTRDPMEDGRNWYACCENNPTKLVDPKGKNGLIKFALQILFFIATHLGWIHDGPAQTADPGEFGPPVHSDKTPLPIPRPVPPVRPPDPTPPSPPEPPTPPGLPGPGSGGDEGGSGNGGNAGAGGAGIIGSITGALLRLGHITFYPIVLFDPEDPFGTRKRIGIS